MASDSQPPQESTIQHCTDVAEFLRILHESGDLYEVRVLNCPERVGGDYRSTIAGWFMDATIAAKAVESIEKLNPPAIYVTLNPCNPALWGRAMSRMAHKMKSTTSDDNILRRRWLFIDIDPKRPAGVSSTDAELAEAVAVSDEIVNALRTGGWPEPLVGASGNGRYLLWRIDLPNDEESRDLIKAVLTSLAAQYDTDFAEVDCSTFNAGRIAKVLGTVARKGDELIGVDGVDDRPHRRSWFIPLAEPLQIVTAEQLRSVAGDLPETAPSAPSASVQSSTAPSGVSDRASKYLAKCDPAVAGEKGHNKLLTAAVALVQGFSLSNDDAMRLLVQEYNPRCEPAWSDNELRHKVDDAAKLPGERGHLLRGKNEVSPDVIDNNAPWADPESIERPEVPIFPTEALPEPLGAWVAATAEACQVPSDLPGMLALAVCAGAVARRVEVLAGRGWSEPLCLYVACLLEPGNRKSAVFNAAMRPLRMIERELIDQARSDVARLESDRRMREAQLKKLEQKGATGTDEESREAACKLAEEIASEPIASLPKLLVDDATAEAIEKQLACQGGRLIVAGCEGGLFDVMAGRYSSGVGNLDCFLKGHAGDDLRVDRVTRGSISVDRCCLTLAYAVQPDVIRGLAEQPSFRGRGLIGRFMYSVPKTLLGKRRVNTEPVPVLIETNYESLVRRLAMVPECRDGEPALLTMSPSASERFEEWQREVETWLDDDGRLAELRDWGGKLCGLTIRLAAILHLVKIDYCEPWLSPIEVETIESAVKLARWAVPHAEAVIALMTGVSGPIDDAAYLLRWLRVKALPEFSRRDAQVHGRSRFDGEPGRLDVALELLTDRGWVRPVGNQATGKAGRPPSPRFAVHPRLNGDTDRAPSDAPSQSARVRGVL